MSDGVSYAGEFILEKCEIVSCGDDRVDVSKELMQLDIYESIDSPLLQGNLVFTDNFGLTNTMPIVGQEILRLKIRTPSTMGGGDFGEEKIIDRQFYINKVNSAKSLKPDVQAVSVEFVSMEGIRNNRTIVDRILTGTYSSIAKQMLKSDLKTKKTVFVEESSGIKKIVANELTPIDIINQCKKEAVSKENGQPTYRFFETLTGFHFRSIQSMYATESAQQYTIVENETTVEGRPDFMAEYARIRDYNINRNPDTMSGTVTGQFSSELTVHDIFNKDIITTNFNYFDQFEPEAQNFTINTYHGKGANSMYSKTAYDQDGSNLGSTSVAKYVTSVSFKDQATGTDASLTTGDGKYAFQAPNHQRWLLGGKAFDESLKNGYVLDLTALGHTYMRAGQVVTINIPRPSRAKQPDKSPLNRFYQGPFLVEAIHHNFLPDGENGPTHMMFMRCVKDCVEEELEFVEELPQDVDDTFFEEDPLVEEFYQDELA